MKSFFSKHVKILAPLYCGINWPLELKFTPSYYSLGRGVKFFIQSFLAFLKCSTSTFNVRNIVLEDAKVVLIYIVFIFIYKYLEDIYSKPINK